MLRCEKCGKEFENYRQLNGHKRIHGPSKGKRKFINKRPPGDKFCLYCNSKIPQRNTYCNNHCQNEYRYKYIHVPAILGGNKRSYSNALKRFISERDDHNCVICGQGEMHNNKPLTLQLDHIDGNSDNNIPSNLRLLCPNCHTQTKTFGSRGMGNRYKKDTKRNRYLRKYKSGL